MTSTALKDAVQAAVVAFHAGRLDEAKINAEAALAQAPGEPTAAQVLGAIFLKQGQVDAALEILNAGFANAPGSAAFPNLLAVAAQAKGDLMGALAHLETASARAPGNPVPLENLGKVAELLGNRGKARAAFERCLEIAPKLAGAITGLARLELTEGNAKEAGLLAERGLVHHSGHPKLLQISAEAALRLGEYRQAETAARALIEQPGISNAARGAAHNVLAWAADGQGHYIDAFAAFQASNDFSALEHADEIKHARARRSVEVLQSVADLTPTLASKVRDWPKTFDTPAPVFFLGFPRSGTTLVQRALTSHPLVAHTELDPFDRAFHKLLHAPDVAAKILALTADDMEPMRAAYWAEVARQQAIVPPGGLLLDWAPYDSQHLAVIAAVFPDARIIFALRDPRDVVLSCFQQRFAPSRAAFEFLDLERAARFYDLTMQVAVSTRDAFSLTLRDVRYDDVVADIEGEMRALVDFMGLPWNADVMAYRNRMDTADIKTPSAIQVTQDVYTSSLGKWRNYADALQPVRSVLDPWAKRWGYDV